MTRPTFCSHWTITNVGGAILVASEEDIHILTDVISRSLVPLLNGDNTIETILGSLAPEFGEHAVCAAIFDFQQRGLIREGSLSARAESAYWELAGSDPDTVARRRTDAAVRVVAVGDASFDGVIAALRALRIAVDETAVFSILVTRNYLDPAISDFNMASWAASHAWMIARPYGRRQWIGPLFIPGRTPCWECLSRALAANGCVTRTPVANLPTTSAVTSTIVATEAAKWLLCGRNPELEGQLRTIDTARLAIETHTVLRHADCPVCGGLPRVAPARLEELVSSLTGVAAAVNQVHREPGLVVCQARGSQWLRPGRDGATYLTRAQHFHGAGENGEEARTSCLGEAAERYSAQYHRQPVIFASLRELGETAIDPRGLLQYSDRQYGDRAAWNAAQPEFHRIGEPFDPDARIAWASAKWFTSGNSVFVPAGFCYLGFTEPFCGADSNGCAAGPTWDDAVLRALLELIERDAVALWWYNRARCPAIDPSSCSRRILCVKNSLEKRGYGLHLLNLTSGFCVPVCMAVCSRADGSRVLLGSAAADSAESAIWSAVLSVAGALITRELGGVLQHSKDQEFLAQWLSTATLDTHPYLAPASVAPHTIDALPRLSGATPREKLLHCVERVESFGLRVAVLDLTRPELGIPAARLIVPGLRPWCARFAPGRLYDAPVTLGWMPGPLTESDLNPIPFVL